MHQYFSGMRRRLIIEELSPPKDGMRDFSASEG